MKKVEGSFELTATDLVGYLNCRQLSDLDRTVPESRSRRPKAFDPLLKVLSEHGFRHEQSYFEYLKHNGLDVVRIDGRGRPVGRSYAETLRIRFEPEAVAAIDKMCFATASAWNADRTRDRGPIRGGP